MAEREQLELAPETRAVRLYFAYGANMDADILAHRVERDGAAFRRRRGILMNYRLAFNKVSSTDPTVGYANVMAAPGRRVEGLLNELDDTALARLDAIELVPHHYTRSRLEVYDSMRAEPVLADVYTATPDWMRPALRPLRSYLNRLLHGADLLSAEYVSELRAVACRD